MNKWKYFILTIILFCLYSCVSHKATYHEDWKRLVSIPNPYFTIYLIGDAGNAPMGESTRVFEHLKRQLGNETDASAIVWLGDNIYPVGLAPESSPYHPEGKHRLLAQLRTMSDYKGYKYFVPGNHDWYTYGRIGLRRQELLVDSFLLQTPNPNAQTNFFIPDKGCGDPQVHDLIDGIGLLMMDSHWFLNKNARSGDQSVCEVSNPREYLDKLKSEINEHQNHSLIVASHHPPYTYAHHGGKFPLKDDIFPLTQEVKWLYLPLPIAGYVFNRVRLRLSEQDVYHPLYKSYRAHLESVLKEKGVSIVASGHEHTLQHIERHRQYFIVSGAGTKKNKVGRGKGLKFAIGEQGYVKLIFKDAKKARIQYIVPGQFEKYNNVAFEKEITLK